MIGFCHGGNVPAGHDDTDNDNVFVMVTVQRIRIRCILDFGGHCSSPDLGLPKFQRSQLGHR